jgi:ketosteroid isomerase-like protein
MICSRGQKFVNDFRSAVAAHDAGAIAACLTEDCRFELPNHPARSFTGRERARQNWTMIFDSVPDLELDLLVDYVDRAESSIGEHLAGLQGK